MLNAEMQVIENGPDFLSDLAEKLIGKVADNVLEGGFSSTGFKPSLKFMKNVT